MNDQETMELCRAVYERLPSWNDVDKVWRYNQGLATGPVVKTDKGGRYELSSRILSTGSDVFPAYSLEYVLDKLPAETSIRKHSWFEHISSTSTEINFKGNTTYFAKYEQPKENRFTDIVLDGATPLQAALRLVLALHDAGVLS